MQAVFAERMHQKGEVVSCRVSWIDQAFQRIEVISGPEVHPFMDDFGMVWPGLQDLSGSGGKLGYQRDLFQAPLRFVNSGALHDLHFSSEN